MRNILIKMKENCTMNKRMMLIIMFLLTVVTFYGFTESKEETQKYEQLIADYDVVIAGNPKNSQAYYDRAQVKVKLGKYEDAIKDYNKAIELNSHYAEAYLGRSVANQKLGKAAAAQRDFKIADRLKRKLL